MGLKTGKPRGNPNWKKLGPSPNPGGRPKALKEALEAFRNPEDLSKLRVRLLMLANDEDGRIAVSAIKEWHDRAYGKAPQAITDGEGGPVSFGVIVLPAEK